MGSKCSKYSSLNVQDPVIYEPSGTQPQGPKVEIVVRSTLKLTIKGTGDTFVGPLVQIMMTDCEHEWINVIRPMYWNVADLNQKFRAVGHIE